MRKDLRKLNGKRLAFTTDHLWFTKGKSWDECKEGSGVRFEARISSYIKGYKGHDFMRQLENPQTKDYRLESPTKVKVLAQEAV